ncbi:hypothetical protein C8J57DRAFT_1509493 [Mycena rebaudengoi]|nr:hypothetical protein C8J57DRAFT_1509493 [Mycena rebaudengoi]
MFLQDIGEDIVLKILAFCDVYAVLRVSETNKSFHHIALTKQLWLHLMQDLASRGLLDSHPKETLDAYSTGEIIEEVRRIICGPATWASSQQTQTHSLWASKTGAHILMRTKGSPAA